MNTPVRGATLRILLFAGVATLAVVAGGWLLQRVRLGVTDADVLVRLERQVRVQVDRSVQSLEQAAATLASHPQQFVSASTDQASARRLFDTVVGAANGDGDLAITAYGSDGQPLAWTGRPSELDQSRIASRDAALFAAPGPLGLRLVAVRPVMTAIGRRVGTVVTERLLSTRRGIAGINGELYTLTTDIGSVALRTRPEGAGERPRPDAFLIRSPSGDVMLEASVKPSELEQARQGWARTMVALVMAIAAVTLLLLVGPLLDIRAQSRRRPAGPSERRRARPDSGQDVAATAGMLVALLGGWALLLAAGRAIQGLLPVFAASIPAGTRPDLLRAPFDVLVCGLALVALVGVAFDTSERWRLQSRLRRRPPAGLDASASYAGVNLVVGIVFATLLAGYQVFLRDLLPRTGIDILHFSVHPWDLARLSLTAGILLFHTGVLWLGVLLFRVGLAGWRVPRTFAAALLPVVAWLAAFVIAVTLGIARGWPVPWITTGLAYAAAAAAAIVSRGIVPRFRHASQGLRLILGFFALLLPAVVMYPTLVQFAEQTNRQTIEKSFAPEVMHQREAIKTHVANTMDQIDAVPYLPGLVEAAAAQPDTASTQTAFLIWSRTDLAVNRIASAVELYSRDGALVSRFALYLPEFKSSSAQPTREPNCSWDLYEYVSPFGSEQRKLLRAGRAICERGDDGQTTVVGSIVVHAMLDYSALPFLSSQSPYYELLRPAEQQQQRTNIPGGDLDLAVYGWSRAPIYSSAEISWRLDDAVFARVYASRRPFWTRLEAGGGRYDVYFMNDRGGIYALGYPTVPLVSHFVNLAELTTLVGLAYLLLLAGSMVFTAVTGRQPASGRALLREIRASFYRKVFLAFVAVSVIPVTTLAFIAQAYIGGRLRADTEAAAVKTTAVAQRVIEDYGTIQQQAADSRDTNVVDQVGTMFGDDVMVGLSRVIDQDVNMFLGPKLVATSERDLFESQLLPMRTPADVYRAIALDRQQSLVGRERTGEFTYMLAAAPVRVGGHDAILTVPLMLRQQEIEREIDDLNRRIVLATLLFILLGAGIGYPMAERIADPVNRLTRATRRIARGEFDARIAATSSDELRRLVEAFNSMAADLQRQRQQLERTNRLEAWAEMARQVAHEIKNPLTPIQLSAEHLQRVHSDRGRPLSPVLDECVASILSQVRLLRQISGEFSSFASSPTAKPAPTALADLVEEVVGPYRSGLAGRISLVEDVPPSLPPLFIDRILVGRALANIIENALHAMPGQGTLTIRARVVTDGARRLAELAVTDTGVGMDAEALARLFEPYFSTKAIGTGLGLAIAQRNVDLNGGTITVESDKGKGTTVYVRLPTADEPATL